MKDFIYLLFILFVFASCRSNDTVETSPSERNRQSINNLRKELIDSPHGWRIIYFSKTDSLLFSNKDANIDVNRYRGNYGYGGHFFTVKFRENGSMEMLSDLTEETAKKSCISEFEVRQNTYTQLSFTTFNPYFHRLINDKYSGSSDFLYYGKNLDGDLVFKTVRYLEPAREYIVFQRIKNEEDSDNNALVSYKNRTFFEKMSNPQIVIRRGSKIFFQSDVYLKRPGPFTDELIKEIETKRYYLFIYNKDITTLHVTKIAGLGSGYVGTDKGLTLRTGIRYSKDYIFYDFQKQGDKFVAELVRVYDPIRRKYRLVSKHLAPDNVEFTGYIAEIWDKQI